MPNVPNENRFQQLVDAGIINNPGDLSPEARQVILDLTDDEFACLLSVRQKLSDKGRERYDDLIPFCGF